MALGLGIESVDSRLNLMLLCPSHHVAFDRFDFTLVPLSKDPDCHDFRVTPVAAAEIATEPPASLHSIFYKVVKLQSTPGLAHPLPHLFLVKTLLRFKLKCTDCDKLCEPTGFWTHRRTHRPRGEKEEYPLPHPCSCDCDMGTPAKLYQHMVDHHREMMYKTK
jgi:hypothetical protein